MSRTCPDDGAALERRTLYSLALDVCPLCAGIYFDEGEIAALQRGGPVALVNVERAALPIDMTLIDCDHPKRCPGCRRLMCAYAYRYSSDVRLDGCEACGGVWVQDGELAQIATHLSAPAAPRGGTVAARRTAELSNAATRHAQTLRTISTYLP